MHPLVRLCQRFGAVSLLLLSVYFAFASSAIAQNKGVSSDGRDYYVGYMPSTLHLGEIQSSPPRAYILIGSFSDNTVTISYFDPVTGVEQAGSDMKVLRGRVLQIAMVLDPTRPGEIFEFKSAHITSKFPISVQVYEEGASNGGMYSAIPTNALGKSYVAECWNDIPQQDVPAPVPYADSASSEFMIIAAYDNTTVTYTPNSTTCAGVIGVNTGKGATGVPHPRTISLRRGETFWVRSLADNSENDLTGSTIVADKPIAVIAGQERALIGEPSAGVSQYSDIRDIVVEQMTPVESWDWEYPAVPFFPAASNAVTTGSYGDIYRVVTSEKSSGEVDLYQGTSPYSRQVGPFQTPAAQFNEFPDAVNIVVPATKVTDGKTNLNSDGTRKKMNVAQYDYFRGDGSIDVTTFTTPNEMNVIPLSRYRNGTVFKVPVNSWYRGAQFMNLITLHDSTTKMDVSINGKNPIPLSTLLTSAIKKSIPFHPELTGYMVRLAPGDYMITGNTPFGCYSYGRTEGTIKLNAWGYAAPTGQYYGSRGETQAPRIEIKPFCDHWDVRVTENQKGDQGISDLELLKDPNGDIKKPGYVSYNVSLDPQVPQFVSGDSSVSFTIHVNDTRVDAYAAVYAVDRAGNDTVFEFHYTAQKIFLSADSINFHDQIVGNSVCSTFVAKVLSPGTFPVVTVSQPVSTFNDKSFTFTTVPALPADLKVGDSVIFNLCFNAPDTMAHKDTLSFRIGCVDFHVADTGRGRAPIIFAYDHDFGVVAVGDNQCDSLRIENIGNADLVLDKKWVLQNLSKQFSFQDDARLPITVTSVPPHNFAYLHFCFAPLVVGPDTNVQNWGTNVNAPYLHQKRDSSILIGTAVKPGLTWDRTKQPYSVICDSSQVQRMVLMNPSPGGNGKTEQVNDVSITGPDAAEFTIIGDSLGYLPLESKAWALEMNEKVWVDVRFIPNLTKGYAVRHATITAVGLDKQTTSVELTAVLRHATLSISPASYDFGIQTPGTVLTKTFTVYNTGDADALVDKFPGISGDFVILSGPKVGDRIPAGDSAIIVVQFTTPANGTSATSDSLFASTAACTPQVYFGIKGFAAGFGVDGTGHDFKLVYKCQNGTGAITAKNVASKGAILTGVDIYNDPTLNAKDADEFAFVGTATPHHLAYGPLAGLTNKDLQITFTPLRNGPALAKVIYHFLDTSVVPSAVHDIVQDLTAIGYSGANVLSVKKEYGNQMYTASTANEVTIPVQLKAAFDPIANIYNMHFVVRYLRDQFIYEPAKMTLNGLTSAGPVNPTSDPSDNNYELLTFDLQSATPITNLDTVAHLTWKYVIAKDSITPFTISDLKFYDQSHNEACWIASSSIDGTFFGTNNCADHTIRQFMRDGNLNFVVNSITPNPVRYISLITYSVLIDNTPLTIDVRNMLGDQVATISDGVSRSGKFQAEFDATNLPAGVYMIRFTTPGMIANQRVVVKK